MCVCVCVCVCRESLTLRRTRLRRQRARGWDADADAGKARPDSPKVRAVVTVKGQGDLLFYSSAKPVSLKARKIVRRLSVEASAAQAVADVVNGGRGRRVEGPKGGGDDGGAEAAGAEAGSLPQVDGAAVIGLSQSPWVEIGESREWPFEYGEESGELVVTLPLMREEAKDTGRWALTFSWPLTEAETSSRSDSSSERSAA